MKCESLIFDIDGTLWDSRSIVAEGYNRQLIAEGHPELCITPEDLRRLFGKTMRDIADAMLATIPVEDRYDLMERCMDNEQQLLHNDPCQIAYEGVVETLKELSKQHRLFIVSNSQSGYPELLLEKLELEPYFTGTLCFGQTQTDKGTTIRTLMEQHDITSACYIGDIQGDLEATRKAGLPFIWASYGFGQVVGYDARIDTFPELLELFE